MHKPFSVRDFSDMLRILEAQPEWRSRMRQALFPEIDVPKALEKLAESTVALQATLRDTRLDFANFEKGQAAIQQDTQDLKAGQQELFQRTDRLETGQQEFRQELSEVKSDVSVLKSDVSVLKSDVSVLKSDVSVLKSDVSVLKSDVSVLKSDVSVLKSDVKEIKSDMGAMRTDVASLKGKVHEGFYRDKAGAIFGIYLRGGREATNQIADRLHDAVVNGLITQDEFIQVLAADLLWSGRARTDNHEVVLVVEASWLAQSSDVERAYQRASVLQRLGFDALAVAAGNEWDAAAEAFAQEMGVVRITNGSVNIESWQNARALVNRE